MKCHLQVKFLCQKTEKEKKNPLPNELSINEKIYKFPGIHLLSSGFSFLVILF